MRKVMNVSVVPTAIQGIFLGGAWPIACNKDTRDIYDVPDVWCCDDAAATGPEHTVNLSDKFHRDYNVLNDLISDHDIRTAIFQREGHVQVRFSELPAFYSSASQLIQPAS